MSICLEQAQEELFMECEMLVFRPPVMSLMYLLLLLYRLWIGELTGYELMAQADWICKLTCVVSYTTSDFSVWLIIAVTCERYSTL